MVKPNIFAVSDVNSAGEITYCRLSGDVDVERLKEVWAQRSLDPALLPPQPTDEYALKRACLESKGGFRVLLRPLQGITGYALVTETADGKDLTYDTDGMLRAYVVYDQTADGPKIPRAVVEPENHPKAKTIRALFEEYRGTISSRLIGGNWLWGKLAALCQSVSLRDTGGVYFIPADCVDRWHVFCEAIEEASLSTIFHIPAVRADEAIFAVLAALQVEAESEIASMAEELSRADDGALGARALRSRAMRSRDVRAKVQHYEKLFERAVPGLQEKIDALDADIASAVLLLSPDGS